MILFSSACDDIEEPAQTGEITMCGEYKRFQGQ